MANGFETPAIGLRNSPLRRFAVSVRVTATSRPKCRHSVGIVAGARWPLRAGSDFPGVRGFIRSDGVHEAAFRVPGTVNIKQSTGTPLGSPGLRGNGAPV
jgi:hypothetical protein